MTPPNTTGSDDVLFLDLETTGLNPKFKSILEVAGAVVSPNLEVKATFQEVVFKEDAALFAEMDAWCTETHTSSGLVEAVRASTKTAAQVDELLSEFVRLHFPGRKVELAGYSVHFDKGFLDHHMPRTAALLSHQIQDVSGAARMLRRFAGKNVPRPLAGVAHRAMPDVMASVEQLRIIVQEVKGC